MNFFAHQERARGASRRLVLLFLLATVAIVLTVDAVVLIVLASQAENGPPPFGAEWFSANAEAVFWTSLAVVVFIGGASLIRIASLSSGGGEVAKALGGSLVPPDTRDPQYRRLRNVVEEMAIASGVPVPEVYVLEEEQGLNAFAAGHGPADAAVAVTRGALERLSRDELQGVIAHEFSHILNGDMRLNLRLMGVQFGILAIALLGRLMLRSTRHFRVGRSREGGGILAALVLIGLAFVVIGYLGVLFARLIQAAVSRSREYLADASAVQFTRHPDGIAGALKKIAGYDEGSRIVSADATEVGHMLFASGFGGLSLASLFATHPPIDKRIRAIDPSFDPARLERNPPPPPPAFEAMDEAPAAGFAPAREFAVEPLAVVDGAGVVEEAEIAAACRLHQSIPASLLEAARSPQGAELLVLALLLGEGETQAHQLGRIEKEMDTRSRLAVATLNGEIADIGPAYRLPLLELTFPALRMMPHARRNALAELARKLAKEDGLTSLFEYTLTRLLELNLDEVAAPAAPRRAKVVFDNSADELQVLFSTLAHVGHDDAEAARRAYVAGVTRLLQYSPPPFETPCVTGDAWHKPLDRALARLDGLSWPLKEKLVEALVVTVRHDERIRLEEAELLRAICACLHCPLPMFREALGDGRN